MARALIVTCPRCGQDISSGVIAEKGALGNASKIRVHCKNCDENVQASIRDVRVGAMHD